MSTIDTIVARPALFTREHASTVTLGLYDVDDAAVTPTAVAVVAQREGRTVATLTGVAGAGTASTTHTWPADTTAADDYVLVWTITESSGAVTTHRQVASVCLQRLHAVIRVQDIVDRMPRLDPDGPDPLLSRDAAEAKALILSAMATAWDDIEDWLREQGRRSHLILDSYATRRAHIEHTLELLLRGTASVMGPQMLELARDHGDAYHDALKSMSLQYAPADGSGAGKRAKAVPPLMVGGSWEGPRPYTYQQTDPSTLRYGD